jgi:AcrR family transcriptional regulator
MKNQRPGEKSKPTKERIFDVALELFSEKGFDAVSVREIAREVGIRESSIYNHYKSKEAILDTIIDHFVSGLHHSSFSEEDGMALLEQSPEAYLQEGARMYMEQINTPQMEKIWRLVSIETYHNEKIREFFKKELLEAPLNIWENTFQLMIDKKMIKPLNPQTLAHEYFSFPIYLFFEYYVLKYDEDFDSFMDLAMEKMANHNEFFLEAIKI